MWYSKSMKNSITLRDIARELGISAVTVSKALSDKEGVGEDLKQRIRTRAEEMGYRKNLLASDLRGQSGHNIGLLVRQGGQNAQSLEHEISRRLLEEGYYSVIEVIKPDQAGSLLLESSKVDGVLVIGAQKPAFINTILQSGEPCVLVDFFYDAEHLDSVIGDNLYGGYALTKHLISLGHQDVGFVGNPHLDDQTMDRYLGYCKAINEFGFCSDLQWVYQDTDDYGQDKEPQILEDGPSAYVCSHSKSAYKYIGALKKAGFEIPSDRSIASFEDDVFSTLCVPPLTVFSLDYQEMALTAAQAIIRKIGDPSYHFGRKTIGGRLVARESTTKLKKSLVKEINRFG